MLVMFIAMIELEKNFIKGSKILRILRYKRFWNYFKFII